MVINRITLIERIKQILKGIYRFLFQFSNIPVSYKDRPYIMTPCNHLFHSGCIINWLQQKKECPTCRADLTLIDFRS